MPVPVPGSDATRRVEQPGQAMAAPVAVGSMGAQDVIARVDAALATIHHGAYMPVTEELPEEPPERAARRVIDGYVRQPRSESSPSPVRQKRAVRETLGMLGDGAVSLNSGHAQGLVDIAIATSALPIVAMFSLGFSITVLLDPEREMFDGSLLLLAETIALSLACALATYCITFSLYASCVSHLAPLVPCV